MGQLKMIQNIQTSWTVWIDDVKKIISTKKIPNTKQVYFEDRNIGIQKVSEPVSKGYKIG